MPLKSEPPRLRVSIVEDDKVTRDTLCQLITRCQGLECYLTYANAEQALEDVPRHPPDVLMVDLNLPGINGVECIRTLKMVRPHVQMLVLTTYEDAENIFDSLRAGASGYLLKRSPASEIAAAIREVHEGGSPMSMQIARKVVSFFHPVRQPAPEVEKLSSREHDILSHLSRGLQYKEIADALGISPSTVRAHLHTIYNKLHVQSRLEAVAKYVGS
ncbi:MAG: response regulator transcription factor [Roseimicrobium sp.]